jgi:aminopeptidase N
MINENTQKLAERIALLLQQQENEREQPKDDFSVLQATLEKINQRLDKIEAQFAAQNSNQTQHSALSTQHLMPHPSQEKFAVEEAIVPEITGHFEKEKACTFEPNGKPCDHCAMCNTRGF